MADLKDPDLFEKPAIDSRPQNEKPNLSSIFLVYTKPIKSNNEGKPIFLKEAFIALQDIFKKSGEQSRQIMMESIEKGESFVETTTAKLAEILTQEANIEIALNPDAELRNKIYFVTRKI